MNDEEAAEAIALIWAQLKEYERPMTVGEQLYLDVVLHGEAWCAVAADGQVERLRPLGPPRE